MLFTYLLTALSVATGSTADAGAGMPCERRLRRVDTGATPCTHKLRRAEAEEGRSAERCAAENA